MIQKLLILVVLIAIFVLGLSFAVSNAHPVQFNYFVGSTELVLSLLLVVTLSIGAILGVLASFAPVVRLRTQIWSLRKREAVAQEEIQNLRTMPIKDAL